MFVVPRVNTALFVLGTRVLEMNEAGEEWVSGVLGSLWLSVSHTACAFISLGTWSPSSPTCLQDSFPCVEGFEFH